jgi:hypothetical protein
MPPTLKIWPNILNSKFKFGYNIPTQLFHKPTSHWNVKVKFYVQCPQLTIIKIYFSFVLIAKQFWGVFFLLL